METIWIRVTIAFCSSPWHSEMLELKVQFYRTCDEIDICRVASTEAQALHCPDVTNKTLTFSKHICESFSFLFKNVIIF